MQKQYKLISDGDGHRFAVLPEDYSRAEAIFEKDWDDWTEEDQDFIDSLKQIDGNDFNIILLDED